MKRRNFIAATLASTSSAITMRAQEKQDRQEEKNQAREGADGPGSAPDERSRAVKRRFLLDRCDHERLKPAPPGHQARQVECRALLLRLRGQTPVGGHAV